MSPVGLPSCLTLIETRPLQDVLFLDEPTSGLDSVAAAKVVAVLHDLAHDPVQPTTM